MTGSPTRRRPVTVVVPVYDDLDGLERCIEALRNTIDRSLDRVLLCNDVGPNADAIERRLLELTADNPAFEYARNDRNLGFVGNCNRAALELDTSGNDVLFLNSDTVPTPGFLQEMAEVLAEDDSIGVVCARSDNATIASMPYAKRNPRSATTPTRSVQLHRAVRDLLPRTTVAPVAMGFCFLIRRECIDRFGLFDEIYAPGYGEENDFCLRINEHGYQSVFANRAIVLHTGSTSFSGDRGPSLRLEHERILLQRYPFYSSAVALFLGRYRDAVDAFADAFLPDDGTIRVALHLPDPLDSGIIGRVQQLLTLASDDLVITLVTSKAQLRSVRQAFPGTDVLGGGRVRQIFDIAVALGPLTSFGQLAALNANAPRWLLVDSTAHHDRWSDAVRHHRSTAIDRIVRRFDDRSLVWSNAVALVTAIRESVAAPIDAVRLRARWTAVADIAEATGFLSHPTSVSLRRLTALSLGARNPRLVRQVRRLTGRG
jgi:GT2 family glycosyltransferase